MVEVRIEGITKQYKNLKAVDDLSLKLNSGEFVSILGPSGCGKTTTLRIIAGLIRPNAGKVFIGEKDVSTIAPYKRGIGMVFQDYALFPHMTIADNIGFGLKMRKEPQQRVGEKVREVLDLVHLEGMEKRFPAQMSGGQQQRVALARALAIEPDVLLLDEPLSNLDLKLRQAMRVELRRIQRKVGITTIFVTHDQGEALAMSDNVVVMNQGRLEQQGAPVALYEKPATRFVASFMGDVNFFEGKVRDGLAVDPCFTIKTINAIGLENGAEATVMVRPEKIRLRPGKDSAGANSVVGCIESYVYLGSLTRYTIQYGNDKWVIVDSTESGIIPPGTSVIMEWDTDNCIYLQNK